MNKYNLINDRVDHYDNMMCESVFNYTNPRKLNAALNKNFKIFGTMDNMLRMAQNKIRKQDVYGLNHREMSIAEEIADKIIGSMIGNPLLQLFVLSLFALGMYKLLRLFLVVYTATVSGLKSLFSYLGTSVKDFFGIQANYNPNTVPKTVSGADVANKVVNEPQPQVNAPIDNPSEPDAVRIATNIGFKPQDVVVPKQANTADTSRDVEQGKSDPVNTVKVAAAAVSILGTKLVGMQKKAQDDIPVMDMTRYDYPPKPALYNKYADYDTSTGTIIPKQPVKIQTRHGEIFSPDGVNIIGNDIAIDAVSKIMEKGYNKSVGQDIIGKAHSASSFDTSYGKYGSYSDLKSTPDVKRRGDKIYSYRKVIDALPYNAFVYITEEIYVFTDYILAQNYTVNHKFAIMYTKTISEYNTYIEDSLHKHLGKITSIRGKIRIAQDFYKRNVIGFYMELRPNKIYYLPSYVFKKFFTKDFNKYLKKRVTRFESLKFYGEHKKWQYLMLK